LVVIFQIPYVGDQFYIVFLLGRDPRVTKEDDDKVVLIVCYYVFSYDKVFEI